MTVREFLDFVVQSNNIYDVTKASGCDALGGSDVIRKSNNNNNTNPINNKYLLGGNESVGSSNRSDDAIHSKIARNREKVYGKFFVERKSFEYDGKRNGGSGGHGRNKELSKSN